MESVVIELEDVHKSFGRRPVLKGLDLSVPERSVFAFLGNNGQGKSTTIRLIVGLLAVDRGAVRVLGKDVRRHRREILAAIGCIVDSPSAYSNLNAAEFLSIGCTLKGLSRTESERVLDIVGLSRDKHLRIGHYSLGMKQRLALAHALLGQPKLLILDEPTNGLDPEGIQEMRQLLIGLPEAVGCSIFFASHQLDEVEKIASHLAVLRDGRIQLQTSLRALTEAHVGSLSLSVCDAGKGASLLTGLGFCAECADPNTILVTQVLREDASHINASLVNAGLDLHEATYRKPSLEQWFLQSTASGRGCP